MGLFDLFKDNDDYEGSHNARSRKKSSSNASEIETVEDVLKWLETNKAIILAEDGGLIVYTDGENKSFLSLFSEESEVVDEELDEYAEVNREDLLSLFEDLADISYLVFNPNSHNLTIPREALEKGVSYETADEEQEIELPFPARSRKNRGRDDKQTADTENADVEAEAPKTSQPESEFERKLSESESLALSESQSESLIDLSLKSETDSLSESHSLSTSEQQVGQISEEKDDLSLFDDEEPAKKKTARKPQRSKSSASEYTALTWLPTTLIQAALPLYKKKLKRLYLASLLEHGDIHYFVLVDAEGISEEEITALSTEKPLVSFVAKDKSTLSPALEQEEFLIYDADTALAAGRKHSEKESLRYISENVLFSPEQRKSDEIEVAVFTSFDHIPVPFLNAFERFNLGSLKDFSQRRLERTGSIKSVHVNPFTDGILLPKEDITDIAEGRKRVLIIGLGLIGASIALGIRRGQDVRTIAYDKPEVLEVVSAENLADKVTDDLTEAAAMADVIILATPVDQTVEIIKRLAEADLKEHVLITDTASTKVEVMKAAQLLKNKDYHFVGGHPMAGSHKEGPLAADVNLFENAYYVLTEENEDLEGLLTGLHAKFIVMTAQEHDAVTSQVSHFPHVLASSLVLQSSIYADKHPEVAELAAGGFRDMTRIVDSNSELWAGVMCTNKEEIIDRIEDFKEQLDKAATILKSEDESVIRDYFEASKQVRQAMEIHKGALQEYNDLFVNVADEQGAVLKVLQELQDFSITNIKINENNREDTQGVLQISFRTIDDLQAAKDLLKSQTRIKVVDHV